MATDDRYRINITVPAFHKKWLFIWAYLKTTSPTNLAGNTLQNRVEANLGQIKEMLNERAEDLGISPEELIKMIIPNNELVNEDVDEQ
jgi:hypothetical protein